MSEGTLYERTNAWVALELIIAANGGELTSEMEAQWDAASFSIDEKLEANAFFLKELEAIEMANEARIAELQKKQARIRAKKQWLTNYMVRNMEKAGKTKIGNEYNEAAMKLTYNPVAVTPLIDAETVIRDPRLLSMTDEELAAVTACVKVTPEKTVVTPAVYQWDKAKLKTLRETHAGVAQRVASFTQKEKLYFT